MGYPFPPDVSEKVRRLMESGKYQSEEELVVEALDALEQDEMQFDALKADIANGVEEADRGLAHPLELAVLLKRMRERYVAAATHAE